MDAMEDLAEQREGYVEVRSSESEYPLLAIGFRHDRAVLHRFSDAQNVYLLRRGLPPGTAAFSIRIMDVDVEFDGVYGFPLKEACEVVARFFGAGSTGDVGQWVHL